MKNKPVLLILLAGLVLASDATARVFVTTNSTWRYFKGTSEASNPINAWRELAFDDSAWLTGSAPFHYGTNAMGGDDSLTGGTILSDMRSNYTCVFLRQEFVIDDTNSMHGLWFNVWLDDGLGIWINGQPARNPILLGGLAYINTATSSREGTTLTRVDILAAIASLRSGTNVLCLQAFNRSLTDDDFRIEAELAETPPTLAFASATATVQEIERQVILSVVRTTNLDAAVTVDYATTNGTALAGQDYVATNGTLTFAQDQTEQTIVVPILNDGVRESTESFQVKLSNPGGGAILGTVSTVTVSISDNDPGCQIEFPNYWVGENAGPVVIAVLRGSEGDFPVTVDYATIDGTALAGQDYVAGSGTLNFAAGEQLKFIPVAILNDGLKESDKTFGVTLSNPSNQVLGPQTTATVTIVDNDAGVQFQPYNLYRVAENEGARRLTVVRGNDGNLGPITVDYATSNLTATAGVDYVATNGTLSFAQGEMVQTLTLPILYDELPEADEQFKVTLSNPTGGAVLGPNATATLVILDITNPPPHCFGGIAVQPDRSVQLTLGGCVDAHFKDYFDLYPIEVSSNLVDWTPLVTLLRTNTATNALSFTDTQATNLNVRFYRTASNHLITPWVKPTGPFTPGVVSRLLTDPTRRNRYWLSTNCAFMISVWYPAVAETGRLPGRLMDLQLAQDPTWMAVYGYGDFTVRMPYLKSHALRDAPCATNQAPYPILLNSPGWTGTRLFHELGANLASHGYVVVSVDHYDVTRTVFPDGTYLRGDIVSSISPAGLQDRARDLVFVLDELARWNTNDPVFAGRLDLAKVAATGGSWGGVTASEFGRIDERCHAVIGLDPMPYSSAPQLLQLKQPVLQINASGNFDSTPYGKTTNNAVWFQISSTDHMMVAGFDWYWAWRPSDVPGGREAARTINAYTLWFLNKHLKGGNDPIPALADYPRVNNLFQK